MSNPKDAEEIQGPARIDDNHVQDRAFRNEAGELVVNQSGWRKLTPIQKAAAKGQLEGGNKKYTARDRLDAGETYASLYNATEPHGRDSTQALNVSRSTSGGQGNDAVERSWDVRLAVESYLTETNRLICHAVLGEDCTPAKAIQAHAPDFRDTVSARFRDALDNLIVAQEAARRWPGRFNMRIVGDHNG